MKDKLIKILKRIGEKLLPLAKPLGIRTGISLALAMLLALIGVVLVCGTFLFKPWIISALVIFGIAIVSVILSMLLSLLPPALNKVLMTVYSFAEVWQTFTALVIILPKQQVYPYTFPVIIQMLRH
jgi:hypothetical protein